MADVSVDEEKCSSRCALAVSFVERRCGDGGDAGAEDRCIPRVQICCFLTAS